MGDKTSKSEILQGFTAASGFLRRELAERLTLRHIPQLSFHFDNSIQRGAEVIRLIEQVAADSTKDEDEN